MEPHWDWELDGCFWQPFDAAVEQQIETAFSAGQKSVNIGFGQFNYTMDFTKQGPRQIHLTARTVRDVRRVVAASRRRAPSQAQWEWLGDNQKWTPYTAAISAQLEAAHQADEEEARITVNHQMYLVDFGCEGVQINLQTGRRRKIKRRLAPSEGSAAVQRYGHLSAAEVPKEVQPRSDIMTVNEPPEDDCCICMSSLAEKQEVVELSKCKHFFHKRCIDEWFRRGSNTCPYCNQAEGPRTGRQPPGIMTHRIIPHKDLQLEGFKNTNVIEISYSFPSGIQGLEHPSPGVPYSGDHRVAYLPDTSEGREVLGLLQKAWERRLIFTVGRSVTTGRDNAVVWAGIHHKTRVNGGATSYGYPDPTYLSRVKEELRAVGVE